MKRDIWLRDIHLIVHHDDYEETRWRPDGYDASGRLNGIGRALFSSMKDHFRKEKYYIDNIKEIVVQLRKSETTPVLLERHSGVNYLKVSAVFSYDDILGLPSDREIMGESLISLYEQVLNQVRGKHSIPDDFLVQFLEDFRSSGYCVEYGGIKRTFKDHGIRVQQVGVCAPDACETYLAVKKVRSRQTESRVRIWSAKERGTRAANVLHDIHFDGAELEVVPVSNGEYEDDRWTTFYRYNVPISEFHIGK